MLPSHTGSSRQGSLAGSLPGSSPRSPQGDASSAGGSAHDLRRRIRDLEGQLAQTTASMHVAEGGRDVATRGQNDLAKTVRRLTRDLRDLERQVGELQAERSRLQAEVASLLQDPDTTQAHTAQIAALQDRVGRREMEIADMARAEDVLRQDLGVLVSEREDLVAQISAANEEIDRLQYEIGVARIEAEELRYTLRLTEGSLTYARRAVDLQHSGSAAAGSQADTSFLDQVRAERESARSERDEARAALDESSRELATVRSELEAARVERDKTIRNLAVAHSDRDSALRQRDTAIEDLDRVAQGLTVAETQNRDLRTYCSPLSGSRTVDLTSVVFPGAKLEGSEKAVASLQDRASDLSRRQDDLVRDLASTVRARDEVRAERDDALGRLAIVASAMRDSVTGSKPPLPNPASIPVPNPASIPKPTPANMVGLTAESTVAAASGPKRSRDPSPNPDPPSDPASKRPRQNPPVVVPAKPAGSTPPPSPGSDHGDTPPPSPDSDHGSPIRPRRPRRQTGLTDSEEESSDGSSSASAKSDPPSEDESSEDPGDAEINDDALEQDTLRALSLSRAADRRLRHASPTRVSPTSAGSGSTAGSGPGPLPLPPVKPVVPQAAKPNSGSSTQSGRSNSSGGTKDPKSGPGSVSKAGPEDPVSKSGSAKVSGSASKSGSKDSKTGSAKPPGPVPKSGSPAKAGSSSKAGSGSAKSAGSASKSGPKDLKTGSGSSKRPSGSQSGSGSKARSKDPESGSGPSKKVDSSKSKVKGGSKDPKSGSGSSKPSGSASKSGSGSTKSSAGSASKPGSSAKAKSGSKTESGSSKLSGSTSKSGSSAKSGPSSKDPKPGSGSAKSSGSSSKSGSAVKPGPSSDSQQDLLSPAAPFAPDDGFIPGRFRIRTLGSAEVEPWIVTKMNNVSIASLVIGDLFPIFPTQPGWMFPCSGKAPDPSEYCRDLMTAENVKALLDTHPWEVLQIGVPPLSFDPQIGGGLGHFLDLYLAHENRHLQAYWEATHSLPIEGSQDLELLAYRKQRANRRSHAGNSWKQVLMALIPEMLNGWCDLDLLLDLPFLHFPKRSDKVAWYPGFEARKARQADPNLDRPDPTDLLEALDECNADDPWRNHFRDSISDHPAHRIPRLSEKFLHVKARSSGKLTKSEQTVTL